MVDEPIAYVVSQEDEPPPPSIPELCPGDVLGEKYLLLRPLGLGGMGQVWVARNTATGAEVAIKVLLPERAASSEALTRFRREAYATAQLAHRGIVRVFDLVELDPAHGSLLLVMELLHGHTLAQRLEHQGKLTIGETLDVVLPILSALQHAHGAGVVHRDLKPENIFLAVDPDGQMMPKLLDFGISKMRHGAMSITADGELVGTPCYMSPEQARGQDVDARSDVFAVGILLYECLSGQNPFLADGLHLVVMAVLSHPARPIPDVPSDLWAVIAKALAKHPDDRYASAREVADALRAACPSHADRYVSSPSMASLPPRPLRAPTAATLAPARTRGRIAAITAAVCVAAVSLASAAASFGAPRHHVTRAHAELAPRPEKRLDGDRAYVVSMEAPPVTEPTSRPRSAYIESPRASSQPPTLTLPPPRPRRVLVLRDPGF